MKKAIILLALMLLAAALTFGDEYYGFGTAVNFFNDNFPDDKYIRRQVVTNLVFTFNYFPEGGFLGVYSMLSLGSAAHITEQNERETMFARKADDSAFKVTVSPSIRLQAGSKWVFPLSAGPTIIFATENTSERTFASSGTSSGAIETKYRYQSISGGLNMNLAVMLIPSKSFFMTTGVSMDGIFLRSEKGEMRMNYRTTHNAKYENVRYSTFNVMPFFLLGFRIGGTSEDEHSEQPPTE